ncbi:3-oxoadipate enol-lactonase [Celeribacter arenosi]|uniref:3-oxoadipate enol-lactonase n=1 Tax=Celeribacter arenosi TaxID=792649 RepID=A0ABP7KGQ5_9RHOB
MEALTTNWGVMNLERSQGTGPALVFVNSLGTDLRMWDDVISRLPHDWATLRMDKRGHGLSSTAPEGYTIPDLANDVIAAMDHAGIERAIIVGCSIGGLIAQHIALIAPARVVSLVLSNTSSVLGTAEAWQDRIDAIRANGMADMADKILPRWFGPDFLARPEATLWRTMLAHCDVDGYTATCDAIAGTDITERMQDITQPALVIGGAYDLATPPNVVRALAEILPASDLIIFETTGHLPAVEAPEAFTAALTGFVERTQS